jgi:flagellar motility protein MotE (MotC chaperone)
MALDTGVLDAVTNSNFKSIAEMGTLDALGHRARLNLLAESSLGQILNRMNSLDPEEAAAISGVVSSDLSEKIGELSAAVASAQQLMKGAQTTIPVTGQQTT